MKFQYNKKGEWWRISNPCNHRSILYDLRSKYIWFDNNKNIHNQLYNSKNIKLYLQSLDFK